MTHLTTDPVRHWPDRLDLLVPALAVELHGSEVGTWAVRSQMSRQIALSVLDDGRRVLRISREDRPVTPAGWDRWNSEVSQLLQHLGCAHFVAKPEPSTSTVKVFEEPTKVTL